MVSGGFGLSCVVTGASLCGAMLQCYGTYSMACSYLNASGSRELGPEGEVDITLMSCPVKTGFCESHLLLHTPYNLP